MSQQADALYRHILRACGKHADQKATIESAFALASAETGTENCIGNLEAICAEYLSTMYPLLAQRTKETP